jgi:type IV secretion system protein VirD4
MVPDKYLDSHGEYLADVIEYLVSTIADADGEIRTTFMLDEFVNIPKVQSMLKALRLYRSKGIRVWTFAQDRNGFNKYKDDGSYMPFEESGITLSWGVIGSHARELSEKAGKHTELIGVTNASAGISADSGGHSTSEVQVPNLPISEISQNFSGKAILDAKSKVFVIDRKPYWEISWIRDYVRDPNVFPVPHFDD